MKHNIVQIRWYQHKDEGHQHAVIGLSYYPVTLCKRIEPKGFGNSAAMSKGLKLDFSEPCPDCVRVMSTLVEISILKKSG